MASDGPAQAAAAVSDPLQYDLTTVLSKSLDRHLVFPLLEFLSQKELYAAEDIEAAKLELIEKTNMVDYAVDIYQGLNHTEEVREGGLEGGVGVIEHEMRLKRVIYGSERVRVACWGLDHELFCLRRVAG